MRQIMDGFQGLDDKQTTGGSATSTKPQRRLSYPAPACFACIERQGGIDRHQSWQEWLPKSSMRIFAKCVLLATAVAAIYFWRSTNAVTSQFYNYGGPIRERHGFEVLEYRYRPITVWRFSVEGSRSRQYTYGATEIQSPPHDEWCGNGVGVVIDAVVRYDYGESRGARVFYNFRTGALLTTLNYWTKDAQIAAAIEECNAEAVRPEFY
jgi:hypothetical protein